MQTKHFIFFILLCLPIPLLAKKELATPIPVVVSIAPQKYFVEQIAGQRAKIVVMVPKGFEPEDYEPKPLQLKALAQAKLYFALDVPFELTWLKKFQAVNPTMKMVFTNTDIQKMDMAPSEHCHHHAFHSSTIKDPHIWLSPRLVMIQAKNIRDALIQIDPEHAEFYRKNHQAFASRLKQLDRSLTLLFDKKTKKKAQLFFIFHPSFGYFSKDYGLTQVSVEKEGKSPTLKQLNALVALAKQHHIDTLFITPEYAPKEANVIAKAIHGKTQLIDPLSEAWEENIQHIAHTIYKSLHP